MKRIGILILAVFLVGPFFLGLTATAETKFKDVPDDHWAKKDITYLSEQKIINGYSNEIFGLNDSIKRVDAARMIVRAFRFRYQKSSQTKPKGYKESSKGYDVVATVVDEGIFFGSNGFFYPNNNLTRAEMAAVLTRSFQLDDKNKKVTFKDVKSSHWSYKNIAALAVIILQLVMRITHLDQNNILQERNSLPLCPVFSLIQI